ncbi:MAG: PEP-CTERM sorting domain-containing protein [Verrucomicrobia bacterium]|nr:PEP-CTERM sorting domain-containing protein [Verrucomicrobiota bacterium]
MNTIQTLLIAFALFLATSLNASVVTSSNLQFVNATTPGFSVDLMTDAYRSNDNAFLIYMGNSPITQTTEIELNIGIPGTYTGDQLVPTPYTNGYTQLSGSFDWYMIWARGLTGPYPGQRNWKVEAFFETGIIVGLLTTTAPMASRKAFFQNLAGNNDALWSSLAEFSLGLENTADSLTWAGNSLTLNLQTMYDLAGEYGGNIDAVSFAVFRPEAPTNSVPEPSTLFLIGAGLICAAVRSKRR